MKTILILIAAVAPFTLSSQALACGGYGKIELKQKNFSQSTRDLTSETYQYYLNRQGKEVRHGFCTQFDSAGNVVARALYKHGQVREGSVARIFVSCGVSATRIHFERGMEVRREILTGEIMIEDLKFDFEVNPKQILKIPSTS